ncbi:methanogen output domain 1-containing protein [Methanosarcina sp. KYL-1]|uniref:methanogen output domain 1-containing protein n=1 Tax=Methanosarcina sp. KYL-1 TaxID=2602068 RepID=UPI002101C0AF|nr:methanogen output domain 1-containing protein [Methanosarcina sp. KYL-1]
MSSEESKPKVLIVDDLPENVELMEAYLMSEPYEVIPSHSGKEALQLAKEAKPDIILLDVMMPEIDGYEVCKLLKSGPETRFIPVLMLTALSELEDRIRGIEVGADDFLTKPINRLELKTRVKSLLRVKSLHDQLVAERDSLEIKNRVQNILTAIIPTLLQEVSPDQKKIIINQMTGMVEKTLFDMYRFENGKMDISSASKVCADIMNQLGGNFTAKNGDNEAIYVIKGTRCPWRGEEARKNPILCTLTRKIFSSIALKVEPHCDLEAMKTIGNRNDCCEFLLKTL